MTPIRSKPMLMPRLMRFLAILSLVLVGGWYIAFQARYLIAGPELSIIPEPSVVQHARVVELKGTARNVTALFLNGRPIVTDEQGNFTEPVVLENGYTIMSLEARDRYGRTTRLQRPFVYVAEDEVALSFSK